MNVRHEQGWLCQWRDVEHVHLKQLLYHEQYFPHVKKTTEEVENSPWFQHYSLLIHAKSIHIKFLIDNFIHFRSCRHTALPFHIFDLSFQNVVGVELRKHLKLTLCFAVMLSKPNLILNASFPVSSKSQEAYNFPTHRWLQKKDTNSTKRQEGDSLSSSSYHQHFKWWTNEREQTVYLLYMYIEYMLKWGNKATRERCKIHRLKNKWIIAIPRHLFL